MRPAPHRCSSGDSYSQTISAAGAITAKFHGSQCTPISNNLEVVSPVAEIIIPGDFQPKCCYLAPALKMRIAIIPSEWMKNDMLQTRRGEAIQ
jgi:hypothetical protein